MKNHKENATDCYSNLKPPRLNLAAGALLLLFFFCVVVCSVCYLVNFDCALQTLGMKSHSLKQP